MLPEILTTGIRGRDLLLALRGLVGKKNSQNAIFWMDGMAGSRPAVTRQMLEETGRNIPPISIWEAPEESEEISPAVVALEKTKQRVQTCVVA